MVNYNRLGYEIKRDLANFSKKISKDLNRPQFKFIFQMIYGILVGNKPCSPKMEAISDVHDGRHRRNQKRIRKEKIMSNYMQDDAVGKYKIQTESNISKSNRKSKHKHQYNECLIQYESTFAGKDHISTGLYSYCTRCGKIGDRFKENKSIVKDYLRTIHTSVGKCYSVMLGTELYERYHDKLPVFFVEDIFKDKYINLED